MNERYLFEISGTDTEIQKLEGLLRGFRYEPGEPPELPAANVVAFNKVRPSWTLRVLFAASASLVLVLLAGVWLRSGEVPSDQAVAVEVPQSMAPPSKRTIGPEAHTIPVVAARPELATKVVGRKFRRPHLVQPLSKRGRELKPELSAEERYAFGQLMLALSITGSKLRIVREMIGVPESTPTTDK